MWSERVAVEGYDEIGVKIEYGRQLVLHRVDGEGKRFALLIAEFYIFILEVQYRCSVGAVVDRTCGLHLNVALHNVVGIVGHSEEKTAVDALVERILVVGEVGGVEIFAH